MPTTPFQNTSDSIQPIMCLSYISQGYKSEVNVKPRLVLVIYHYDIAVLDVIKYARRIRWLFIYKIYIHFGVQWKVLLDLKSFCFELYY